ncbi:MAG: lipopolysaccharide assembly protein LapA domain-containing protein [Alphaproteobacteria bacterium]
MRILRLILVVLIAAPVVAFAVGNRGVATFQLWPYEIDLPIFLVVFGALLAGMVLGALVTWMASIGPRRRARAEAKKLRAELAALKAASDAGAAASKTPETYLP